ncbi:dynamin-1-like protein [Adelges cooleyi]|uniref:dynamin-1-like protein n=1 Tax=Adelges cooleyi TaxID=133065 RepID=UPI00217F998A|nr:dynamin-1-like protein [Adelges cooleyi]
MNSLIQVINKLQEVFSVIGQHDINLPQIVVVGTQSSGKSSVLESLVGQSFLPRGTGIVTRAPLVLQMIKYTDKQRTDIRNRTKIENLNQWAVFHHKPKEIFYDFDLVRKEIEIRTDQLAGSNKGITHDQIILKVYTDLFDLTFVDLPGITKVPVGDQPEDIDEQIQALITHYVEKPNSIILAVVTANTDPSTSESLKIARKMDPNGQRTIAVVTKLDLIDKGTLQDAAELLCGRKIPVKLGIIGVVNRSQKDINDNKPLKETIKSEKQFLKENYPDIYKKHGNSALANTLQQILIMHIKETYPVLKKELENMKTTLEAELMKLKTPDSNASFILGILKDINKSYCDTINGNRKDISENEITGGAKISSIINKNYLKVVDDIDPLIDLPESKISNILLNAAGTQKSSFVNEKALQNMISRQLQYLIEPSLNIVDLVSGEMLKIFDTIDKSILDQLARFPILNYDVRSVLDNMLEDTLIAIKEFIKSYIDTQQECINTSNPDFIFQLVKKNEKVKDMYVTQVVKVDSCNKPYYPDNEKEQEEQKKQILLQMLSGINDLDQSLETSKQVKLHQNLTQCYFDFIRRNVRDFVPKRIQHKMVDNILLNFDKYMIVHVFEKYLIENKFAEILIEEEGVIEDRELAMKKLNAVKSALKVMVDIQLM